MGQHWTDYLQKDYETALARVKEQDMEIVRLTKVASDLTEANRKKHNRIEHQKQHIKRLQETIAKLKE